MHAKLVRGVRVGWGQGWGDGGGIDDGAVGISELVDHGDGGGGLDGTFDVDAVIVAEDVWLGGFEQEDHQQVTVAADVSDLDTLKVDGIVVAVTGSAASLRF